MLKITTKKISENTGKCERIVIPGNNNNDLKVI
jgi:hypothetical protein